MTTRREYAASLGLAKPNTRGRLSREAHAAIDKAEQEGMVFTDAAKPAKVIKTANLPKPTPLSLPAAKPETIKHFVRSYILTTKSGQIIEMGNCAKCKNAIMFCRCLYGPYVPDWIKDEVESWLPSDRVLSLDA